MGIAQNVTITKVIETDCPTPFVKTVELYVDGTVDFSTDVVLNYMQNGAPWANNQIDITGFGIKSDTFLYIVRDIALMQAEFPSFTFDASNTLVVGTATNGDDGYQIVLNGAVVSQFGTTETDGTGTGWEHVDAVASRISGVADTGTYDETHWEFTAVNALDGQTACNSGSGVEAYLNTLGGSFQIGSGSGWTPACGTLLGEDSSICDTNNVGLTDDTYTATLAFTGGNNGNTFMVNASAGTVGGDSPTNTENGTITVTNIPEGTDITITVSDTADGGVCSLSRDVVSPSCIPLVINELLFDPPNDLAGDANGDGTRDALDDEFIEFVNNSGSPLDLSGYTISDAAELRHTFPAATIIPPNGVIVVFGGGTPTGSFGGAIVQTASEGQLNLNNAGDVVTIRNPNNNVAIVFNSSSTGLSFGSNQSATRNPDITGDFVLHTDANPSLLFSPGTDNQGATLSIENFNDLNFSFYPNPSVNGFVTIQSNFTGEKEIEIYDLNGRRVLKTISDTNVIDVTSLNTGLYLMKINFNNSSQIKKLIIK